jgi:hypothetical protein
VRGVCNPPRRVRDAPHGDKWKTGSV